MNLSRRLFSLLFMLITLALFAACMPDPRGNGGDETSGDGSSDIPSDDNDDGDDNDNGDDNNNDDDDDNQPDDNGDDEPEPDVENTAPPTECPAGLTPIAEVEPNNGGGEDDLHSLGAVSSPGFCIQGNIDCGNDGESYIEGVDFFVFTVDAGAASADFGLDWTQSADIDFVLQTGETALHEFEDGFANSESASGVVLEAGVEYLVRVACWDGDDGSFAVWGSW